MKMKVNKSKYINFRLEEDLYNKLMLIANVKGVKLSKVIRELLEENISNRL